MDTKKEAVKSSLGPMEPIPAISNINKLNILAVRQLNV